MTDPRLLPANGRVAGIELKGQVEAEAFVEGWLATVCKGWTDLLAAPDGARDRQVLYGETLRVLEDRAGWAFVQAEKDGYVGYVASKALTDPVVPTHTVVQRATCLLPAPDAKATEVMGLPFGARLRITGGDGALYETHDGRYIPRHHVRPANTALSDPATVAQLFFGAPYLWGGNTDRGIDCSGLVQAALIACGIACPGDSYQQKHLGNPATPPYARGDLLFWKGHVAMVIDPQTLIHANGHTMSVAYELIEDAIARILSQENTPLLAHRRLSP